MIENIIYCLSKGYRPVVEVLSAENKVNLWEQFLVQPYGKLDCENSFSTECDVKEPAWRFQPITDENGLKIYSKLFRQFVVLNEKTEEYFMEEYRNILEGKRVVGVLCRGTDYTANKPKGHPIQPEVDEVMNLVAAKMEEFDWEYIYLATDERKMYNQFQERFPGKILINKRNYYDGFYDIKQKVGEAARISQVHFERENDSYYKSLEYFSSVLLLSKCQGLIAGNCGGSRAAMYMNDGKYEFSYLFDLGLYE